MCCSEEDVQHAPTCYQYTNLSQEENIRGQVTPVYLTSHVTPPAPITALHPSLPPIPGQRSSHVTPVPGLIEGLHKF